LKGRLQNLGGKEIQTNAYKAPQSGKGGPRLEIVIFIWNFIVDSLKDRLALDGSEPGAYFAGTEYFEGF
jgi:hypothetical protein